MCFTVLDMNNNLVFFWDASLQLECREKKKKIENGLKQRPGNPFNDEHCIYKINSG